MYRDFNTVEQSVLPLFYSLLDLKADSDMRVSLGFRAYVNEFRTVVLSLPRQVGKTTILAKLAQRHPNSYLVSHGYYMTKHIAATYQIPKDRIISAATIGYAFRGKTITNPIWLLDEPQFYESDFWQKFLETMHTNTNHGTYEPTIFGLGTGKLY